MASSDSPNSQFNSPSNTNDAWVSPGCTLAVIKITSFYYFARLSWIVNKGTFIPLNVLHRFSYFSILGYV